MAGSGGPGGGARVFLSYSRKDNPFLEGLAASLEARGYDAIYDQSQRPDADPDIRLSAQDEWWAQLKAMIAACDVMVFVVSPHSARSPVCDDEIAHAKDLGKRIIAILRSDIDFNTAPERLRSLNIRLDFRDDAVFEAALASLCAEIDVDIDWHRRGAHYMRLAQRWDALGRPEGDLLRSNAVGEANAWAANRPPGAPEPGPMLLDFVNASAEAERRTETRRRRLTFGVAIVTSILAAISAIFGVVALNGANALNRSLLLTQGVLASTADAVTDDRVAEDPSLEPLQQALLETLSPFYQRLLQETKNDPATTLRYAQAIVQLAHLKDAYGSMAAAEAEYANAYSALLRVAQRSNLPNGFRATLADAAFGYAGQLAEAAKRERAREVIDAVADHLSGIEDFSVRRACALIGGEAALAPLEEARPLARLVSAAAQTEEATPAAGLRAREWASCLANAGALLALPGRVEAPNELGASGQLFERAESVVAEALEQRPRSINSHSTQVRIGLARVQYELARADIGRGSISQATVFIMRARTKLEAVDRQLARLRELAPNARRTLADQAQRAAVGFEVEVLSGQLDEAMVQLSEFLRTNHILFRLDPDSPGQRDNLSARVFGLQNFVANNAIEGQTRDFARSTCRMLVSEIDAIAGEAGGAQLLGRAATAPLECIARVQTQAPGPDKDEDVALLRAHEPIWLARLERPIDAADALEAATSRIFYANRYSELTGEDVWSLIAPAKRAIDARGLLAIGARAQIAEITFERARRLAEQGKPEEATAAARACFGPSQVFNAICVSRWRTLLDEENRSDADAPWLGPLIRGVAPGVLFPPVSGHTIIEIEGYAPLGFFVRNSTDPDLTTARILVLERPVEGRVLFADPPSGGAPVAPPSAIGFVEACPRLRLNPVTCANMALTGEVIRVARSLGRQTAPGGALQLNQTRISNGPIFDFELEQSTAWLKNEGAERFAPYERAFARSIGGSWDDYIGGAFRENELLQERVVILLQGKNVFGDQIYTYLRLTLAKLIELRGRMRRGEEFMPADFGEVVLAARGDVPLETRAVLGLFYNMIGVPRPTAQPGPAPGFPVSAASWGYEAGDAPSQGGAVLEYIAPEGAMHKAGLRTGDVVLAVNSFAVNAAFDLAFGAADIEGGQSAVLLVRRGQDRFLALVRPEPRPPSRAMFGVRLESVGGGQGARIEEVGDNSAAQRAGLQVGDIIVNIAGKTIAGRETCMDAVQNLTPGTPTPVTVRRGQRRIVVNVTPAALPGRPPQ